MEKKWWYILAFFLGIGGIIGIIVVAVIGYFEFKNIKEVLKLVAVAIIGAIVFTLIYAIITFIWMKSTMSNLQNQVAININQLTKKVVVNNTTSRR